jgi:hypothetical protein
MSDTTPVAGQELDAEIHRLVFGFTDLRKLYVADTEDGCEMVYDRAETNPSATLRWCYLPKFDHDETGDVFCQPVPRYSESIAAAWQVVEKMLEQPNVRFSLYYGDHCKPTARFFRVTTGDDLALTFAPTAPLAIALAALAAQKARGG